VYVCVFSYINYFLNNLIIQYLTTEIYFSDIFIFGIHACSACLVLTIIPDQFPVDMWNQTERTIAELFAQRKQAIMIGQYFEQYNYETIRNAGNIFESNRARST